jgi:hypothetical protein
MICRRNVGLQCAPEAVLDGLKQDIAHHVPV